MVEFGTSLEVVEEQCKHTTQILLLIVLAVLGDMEEVVLG
tara:strand:+ start:399 stop:518 length:120 start_codon:yes stop_codon:yes gene_type:complete